MTRTMTIQLGRERFARFALVLLLLLTAFGLAGPPPAWGNELVGSTYKIDRHVINSMGSPVGGASFARAGATYQSFDALGQPGTGIVTALAFTAKQGYIYEFFDPPSAPTLLFANSGVAGAQTGFASPVATMPTLAPVFSAIFNDPNAGDTGVKYRVQVSTDPTFSVVDMWDSGAPGTAIGSISNGLRSIDIPYGGSPLSYGGVAYFWRAKFWDSTGEEGVFSGAAQFTSAPVLSITALALPNGSMATGYLQNIGVSGGTPPYGWTLAGGALPPGLGLNAGNGDVGGTPAGPPGTDTFTIFVTDSSVSPMQAASQIFSITVSPALAILTTLLPNGVAGAPYGQTIAVSGGNPPVGFSLPAGALPAGLSLNPATGDITGAPAGPAATANFTVRATDSTAPPGPDFVDQPLSITVADALLIATASLPSATQGVAYTQTLASTGGNAPITWAILAGALPSGLALDPVTGNITGTPAAVGAASFDVAATDSTIPSPVTASQTLTLTVNATPISITNAALPNGTEGASYAATLTVSGGTAPHTWSVSAGALPAGLALDPATGDIAGTPTVNGTFNVSFQVADAQSPAATATASFALLIHPALQITTVSLPSVFLTKPGYTTTVAVTGGESPYSFSVASGLPPGLAIDATTGVITGTVNTLGSFPFTVDVADTTPGGVATTSATLTIDVFALEAPINLSAISSDQRVDLSWDFVQGAALYRVYYGQASGVYDGTEAIEGPSFVGGVFLNSLALTGLTNTRTYFIAVAAVDGNVNEGPKSAEITAQPLPSGQKTHTRILAAGELPEDYRMIGWPVLPGSQDPIANLSDDLGPYDETLWRLFKWDPLLLLYEETATTGAGKHKVAPGEGYWILVRAGGAVDVTGSLADASKDFAVTLQPGWNMVGHPWDFPVDVASCKVDGVAFLDPANTKSRQDVWDFTGTYLSIAQLVSGRAYWVKNLTAGTVTFSIPPQQSLAKVAVGKGKSSKPASRSGPSFRRAAAGDDLPPAPPSGGFSTPAGPPPLRSGGGGGGGGGGCFASGRRGLQTPMDRSGVSRLDMSAEAPAGAKAEGRSYPGSKGAAAPLALLGALVLLLGLGSAQWPRRRAPRDPV